MTPARRGGIIGAVLGATIVVALLVEPLWTVNALPPIVARPVGFLIAFGLSLTSLPVHALEGVVCSARPFNRVKLYVLPSLPFAGFAYGWLIGRAVGWWSAPPEVACS
jgi:hypothetical protein